MRVRRCSILSLEPRESAEFDLTGLLAGGDGLRRRQRWMAQAPHLDQVVPVDEQVIACLGQLSSEAWSPRDALDHWPEGLCDAWLEAGILVVESPEDALHVQHAKADARLRAGHWWAPAAQLHRAARWQGEDAMAATEAAGLATVAGLRERLGVPPPAVAPRSGHGATVFLERSSRSEFDTLLQRRVTCRNYDGERALPLSMLAQMLERVFSAQASWSADEETVFLKKGSPSGGSLHPTEAYLLVQNVDGVTPGLYHYHPLEHGLTPLRALAEDHAELARRMVAGQEWFADAPVLVVMATRFARCFWKYRDHPKAYRAVIMDAGHLSQTLYLAATDLGLGAFVTCAVNERDIEQAFGLDPLEEGVAAVAGFGWRTAQRRHAEFDPDHRVCAASV